MVKPDLGSIQLWDLPIVAGVIMSVSENLIKDTILNGSSMGSPLAPCVSTVPCRDECLAIVKQFSCLLCNL
jgi:hypothetical protein